MSTETDFLTELRPPVEPFDASWSAQTLSAILAQPVAPATVSHRRRSVLLLAPVAVALVSLGVVVAPSLLPDRDGQPGASAAAAEVLTRAATSLEDQEPGPRQYLYVKNVQQTWVDGTLQPRVSGVEDWVPGDRSLPMVERSTERGRLTDTNAIGLDEYETPYYANYPRDARGLLDALDRKAVADDSDEGSYGTNVWDQAFRELQGPAVPVDFKAAVLTALKSLPGVRASKSTGSIGNLTGTVLTHRDNELAFVFDESSGVYLGMTYGIDNPASKHRAVQWTWESVTRVVDVAPRPDQD